MAFPNSLEHIKSRLIKYDNGCWEWPGSMCKSGYGMTSYKRKRLAVHRLVWTFINGPIPDGMCVCHKCDNRKCTNPDHLFLGTLSDNTRDSVLKGRHAGAAKTHCKNGHELTTENTYDSSGRSKKNRRACRKCASLRAMERRIRNKTMALK